MNLKGKVGANYRSSSSQKLQIRTKTQKTFKGRFGSLGQEEAIIGAVLNFETFLFGFWLDTCHVMVTVQENIFQMAMIDPPPCQTSSTNHSQCTSSICQSKGHYCCSECQRGLIETVLTAFQIISCKLPSHQDSFHLPISLPSVLLMCFSPCVILQIFHPGFSLSPHSFFKYTHSCSISQLSKHLELLLLLYTNIKNCLYLHNFRTVQYFLSLYENHFKHLRYSVIFVTTSIFYNHITVVIFQTVKIG